MSPQELSLEYRLSGAISVIHFRVDGPKVERGRTGLHPQILELSLAISRVRSGARRSDRPADTVVEAVWRRPSCDGRVRVRTLHR